MSDPSSDRAKFGFYDPKLVKALFDEMAQTYGIVNTLSSFGFNRRWRRQCLRAIGVPAGGQAVDLMSGMGELCPDLSHFLGPDGRILAVDISEAMCRKASESKCDCPRAIVRADVLTYAFRAESADVVVSSFGLKTFSHEQLQTLAGIVHRVLKPGGVFSFVEISVPKYAWLRWPYMFYLSRVVPLIGALFLGNPDNYRMLGIYTRAFGNCQEVVGLFRDAGLEVEYRSYFFGCASGLLGRRSLTSTAGKSPAT